MTTVILGNGFVAQALSPRYQNPFVAGNQNSDPNYFDFFQEETWQALPKRASLCFITFKLTNLIQTQKLYHQVLKNYKRIIILSSTKTYQIQQINQTIDETCQRDIQQPRVLCENFFMQNNALIVCLSLIYGKERNPQKWLEQKRIKNGAKFINLIHIDELTHYLYEIAKTTECGLFNISDGNKQTWQDIANKYKITLPILPLDKTSKYISNKKLLTQIKKPF